MELSISYEIEKRILILLLLLILPIPGFANPQIDAQIERAESLDESKRYSEAVTAFGQVLRRDPSNVRALMGIGLAYRKLGKINEAIESWKSALLYLPSDKRVHNALGEAYEALALREDIATERQIEHTKSSVRHYESSIKLHSDQPDIIAALARNEVRLSKMTNNPELSEKALRRLKTAKQRFSENEKISLALVDLLLDSGSQHPEDIRQVLKSSRLPEGDSRIRTRLARINLEAAKRYFDQGNYADALKEYQKALDFSPDNQIALKGVGWALWKMGDPLKGIPIWQKLISNNPGDISLMNQLAMIYSEVGQFEDALKVYDQVLQILPTESKARKGRAQVLEWTGRYQEAISEYKMLLAQNPDDASTYQKKIASCLFQSRNFEEAADKWKKIYKEDANDASALTSYARSLYHSGDYENALPLLYEALNKHPQNIHALDTLLLYTQSTNNEAEMFKVLDQLTALLPNDPKYFNLIGQEAKKRKNYDKAIEAFSRSLEVELFQTEPLLGLADTYLLKGDLDSAEWRYREILDRNPNLMPARQGLSDVYTQQGKFSLAAKEIQKVLETYPDDIALQLQLARLEADQRNFNKAISKLDKILETKNKISVPVLLYHRVTPLRGEGVLTLENFEDQIRTLKEEGYVPITTVQLSAFYAGIGSIPGKPILITFDDAFKDALIHADPILQKHDFRATMFVPVQTLNQRKSFFLNWDELRQMFESSRWDIQCHSSSGHEIIATNGLGAKGRFLTNRQWLKNEKRMESEAEFMTRIEQDYPNCRAELMKRLPGVKPVAYSFPYGDFGIESLLNTKMDVPSLNLAAVRANFRVSFVQRKPGYNLQTTTPWLAMRMNVPTEWNGNQLVTYLRNNEPFLRARFLKAQILAEAGQHREAIMLASTASLGEIRTHRMEEVLSFAYQGQENPVEALGHWKTAMAQTDYKDPEKRIEAESRLESLKKALRPKTRTDFLVKNDSNERTLLKTNVNTRIHLIDHFFTQLHYDHGFYYEQKAQDTQSNAGGLGLEYMWDMGTRFSLSGGYRAFTKGKSRWFGSGDFQFPLANRILDFTTSVDYTPIEQAAAIGAGISRLDLSGEVEGHLGLLGSLSAKYRESFISDENRIHHLTSRLTFKVWPKPELTVGYVFDYSDSKSLATLYYTPQGAYQHFARLGISQRLFKDFRYSFSYSPGAGGDDLVGTLFIQQLDGSFEFQMSRHVSLYARGAYSKSPSYRATTGVSGIDVKF